MKTRNKRVIAVVLAFFVCAIYDFVRGYMHEKSFADGGVSAIGGLFSTAVVVLIVSWSFGNQKPRSSGLSDSKGEST